MVAFVDAVIVSDSLADPPEAGVTGDGGVTFTPVGDTPIQAVDSVTDELNPFSENTLTTTAPEPPFLSVTNGLDAMEKSGPPGAVVFPAVSFMNGLVTVKLAEA